MAHKGNKPKLLTQNQALPLFNAHTRTPVANSLQSTVYRGCSWLLVLEYDFVATPNPLPPRTLLYTQLGAGFKALGIKNNEF